MLHRIWVLEMSDTQNQLHGICFYVIFCRIRIFYVAWLCLLLHAAITHSFILCVCLSCCCCFAALSHTVDFEKSAQHQKRTTNRYNSNEHNGNIHNIYSMWFRKWKTWLNAIRTLEHWKQKKRRPLTETIVPSRRCWCCCCCFGIFFCTFQTKHIHKHKHLCRWHRSTFPSIVTLYYAHRSSEIEIQRSHTTCLHTKKNSINYVIIDTFQRNET